MVLSFAMVFFVTLLLVVNVVTSIVVDFDLNGRLMKCTVYAIDIVYFMYKSTMIKWAEATFIDVHVEV